MSRTIRSFSVAAVAAALVAGCAADTVGAHEEAIFGGRAATTAELYGTVGLVSGDFSDPEYISNCTGTLIRSGVVLTAAHCVFAYDEWTGEPTNDLEDPRTLTVIAGALSLADSSPEQQYRVTRIVAHPAYDNIYGAGTGELGVEHDIAVVFTDRPVTQVAVVPTLPASRQGELTPGTPLTITGYGTTHLMLDPVDGYAYPVDNGTLMIGEVELMATSPAELHAASRTGLDTCTGDSGGPVYRFDGVAPVLVGVTSRGDPYASSECGEGGFYTMPSAYEEWLLLEAGPVEGAGGCAVAAPGRSSTTLLPLALGVVSLFLLRRRRA